LKSLGFGRGERTVRLRAGRSRTITWDTDQGWYDIEVTVNEDPSFRRRLSGRVENGREGVSP
jgi:phospholipase C